MGDPRQRLGPRAELIRSFGHRCGDRIGYMSQSQLHPDRSHWSKYQKKGPARGGCQQGQNSGWSNQPLGRRAKIARNPSQASDIGHMTKQMTDNVMSMTLTATVPCGFLALDRTNAGSGRIVGNELPRGLQALGILRGAETAFTRRQGGHRQ